jgi:23S rRNA pseudouridine1911/1915/1917 synthase
LKIEILFEDQDLLVVNKPTGLPVHATLDPARPHLHGVLEKQFNSTIVLFHRLDADTSGVLVAGKSERINKPMSEIFLNKEIKKTYWAVVDGRWLEEWDEIKTYVKKDRGHRWMNVPKGKGGVFAHSRFKLLKSNGEKSWLEVGLETGRTHQIRLHCLSKNHPILGDRLYGKAQKNNIPLALHARKLEFTHPIKNTKLSIEAAPPSQWNDFWLKGL